MANSKVVITFNILPDVGNRLEISNTLSANNIREDFVSSRYANNKTTIGNDIYECAFNYAQAVQDDYNTGLYIVTVNSNIVTIEAIQNGVVFAEVINSTGGDVTTSLFNELPIEELIITDISFSEADSDPCNTVKVSVTTNNLATEVSSPLVINPNVDNPFTFDWVRAVNINIACNNLDGNTNRYSQLPDILSTATTTVDIYNTPTGANITVTHDSSYLLDLEYSLDSSGIWQSSSVFNGVSEGNHNVEVRDQLGCVISLPFAVNVFSPDISVTVPFVYLAKEMSIRFKHNEVWDFCDIYRTENNTLSCEEEVSIPYKQKQKFQTCDLINTQFLSNYETLEANVIKSDGTKDALSIVKRSSNLGATDKRDARYYNADNGQTGIYYTSGDTYNYDTGISNGTYALNGALPNYGAIGNYIFLDTYGWYKIVDIIYDESRDSDVLIIDLVYTGIDTSIIVSSLYNQKNYDVYEFQIDMANYEDEEIQVELLQSDTSFGEYNYLSEVIEVSEIWYNTLELIWYNNVDSWVFYSTGIKNKARVYYQTFEAGNDSSLEIHKTDTTTITIDTSNYETKELVLGSNTDISTGILRQLTNAFLCKELYINRVQYNTNSAPEVEPIKNTNQHVLNISLNKSGDVFNAEWDGNGNSIDNVELVGLLQNNGKYIKLH